MPDGSYSDPYWFVLKGWDSGISSFPVDDVGALDVRLATPLPVTLSGSPGVSVEGTPTVAVVSMPATSEATVTVGAYGGEWGDSIQVYMTGTILLLVLLVGLSVVQVVQGVRR